MRYLHAMVRVTDLDAALEFYCDCMEMEVISRDDYEQGRFTLVMLAAPGDAAQARRHKSPMLELTCNWDRETCSGGRNFGHLAYQVDDIYETCRKLADRGVVINRPPRDGRMAFVRSPDDISIELLQSGDALPVREPWCSMENIGEW